jgi:hypothetical protein
MLNLVVNYSTYDSSVHSSYGCYTWSLHGQTYTNSGVYTVTGSNAYGCLQTDVLSLTIVTAQFLQAKVLLQGAYDANTGLMHDSLRSILPLQEPYTAAPYLRPSILCPNGETTNSSVLSVTGANAIVDWVYIELRNASNSSTVIATRRALVQRDGDIVNAEDGVSPVVFPNVAASNYFVTIKHRNHLGVMSAQPVAFNNCAAAGVYDFTTMPLWTNTSINLNTPAKSLGSVNLMWCSDANNNKNVKYNGLANDKDKVLAALGGASLSNNTVYGYRGEDLNMDGKVRYNGTDNDRNVVLDNIGVSTPNKIITQHTPN